MNDLAAPFNLTLPAISKHIKVLEHAGLITRGRRAQFRPCTIDAAALADIAMTMDTPRGPMEMFFVGEYREVDPKTRLAYTESMADAEGNAMTAEQLGMPPGAHMETSIVVELVDLGDHTKMVMTHIGVPADSPGGQGWAMAIAKLEARVADLSQ